MKEGAAHPPAQGYLDCVHCGLCLSACPTYRVLGSEMDSPRGRIHLMRALDEGRTDATPAFAEHMFRCLDCRACETACPSGVRFGAMIEEVRGRIARERPPDWKLRLALNHVLPHPRRLRAAARLLGWYRKSGMQRRLRAIGILDRFAPVYAAAERMSPEVDGTPGVALGRVYPATAPKQGAVDFFAGCVMNAALGRVNRATVALLNAAGYDVRVPAGQTCCGALASHAGLRDTAAALARTNLDAFAGAADAVIVNASGCGAVLAEYPLLTPGAAGFSAKVADITTFLASTRLAGRWTGRIDVRVGYDDPCHLLHAQGIRNPPRELLASVPGVTLVEVPGADECCGSAGVYNLTQPALAASILERKMEQVRSADIQVLVTGNPGCLFQLQYGVRRHGLDIEVVHIAEFLARAV